MKATRLLSIISILGLAATSVTSVYASTTESISSLDFSDLNAPTAISSNVPSNAEFQASQQSDVSQDLDVSSDATEQVFFAGLNPSFDAKWGSLCLFAGMLGMIFVMHRRRQA